MVYNCCVLGCKTGYKGESEKHSLFKAKNEAQLKLWNRLIARKESKFTFKSYVCTKHFDPEDVIKGRFIGSYWFPFKVPKMKEDAIPGKRGE